MKNYMKYLSVFACQKLATKYHDLWCITLKCSGLLWIIGRCTHSFHFPSCLILSFISLLKNIRWILKPMWGEVRLKLCTGCSFHVLPFKKTIAELYTMECLWKSKSEKPGYSLQNHRGSSANYMIEPFMFFVWCHSVK